MMAGRTVNVLLVEDNIVDQEGKIAKIFDKVTPKGHAQEVLKAVKELAGKKK